MPIDGVSVYDVRPIPTPVFEKKSVGPTWLAYVFYPTPAGAACPIEGIDRFDVETQPGVHAVGLAIRFIYGRVDYFVQADKRGKLRCFGISNPETSAGFETDALAAYVRTEHGAVKSAVAVVALLLYNQASRSRLKPCRCKTFPIQHFDTSSRRSNIMTDQITTLDQLEDSISEPSQSVIDALGRVQGDIMLLGAGGKIGPSLARMAKRASDAGGASRKIIAVDTFPGPDQKSNMEALGIEAIKCDLLDRKQLDALPDAPNVIFMIGMKFGATGQEALTWALNSYLPGTVCERFASSRIAAYSTGNIYGLTPVTLGGSVETDAPNPVGEYAMSALGRERVFEHFSRARGVPVGIIRLNYANELRYGVLVDIARKIWAGEPVDVTMGNANVIWQGDANAMVLQSLERCVSPAFVVNVVGPELVGVRRAAERVWASRRTSRAERESSEFSTVMVYDGM